MAIIIHCKRYPLGEMTQTVYNARQDGFHKFLRGQNNFSNFRTVQKRMDLFGLSPPKFEAVDMHLLHAGDVSLASHVCVIINPN